MNLKISPLDLCPTPKSVKYHDYPRLRLITLNRDTVTITNPKKYLNSPVNDEISGVDYSSISNKRTKTILSDLLKAKAAGEDIAQQRENLILLRAKKPQKDAEAFVREHPEFDYNDVCQDLISILIDCTNKEIEGNGSTPGPTLYAVKRDKYFKKLLEGKKDEIPLPEKFEEMQKERQYEELMHELKKPLLREEINKVLDTLTERERKIVELYYGLDGTDGRSFAKVGREFDRSAERIREILAKAIRKLRHPSRSRNLRPFAD